MPYASMCHKGLRSTRHSSLRRGSSAALSRMLSTAPGWRTKRWYAVPVSGLPASGWPALVPVRGAPAHRGAGVPPGRPVPARWTTVRPGSGLATRPRGGGYASPTAAVVARRVTVPRLGPPDADVRDEAERPDDHWRRDPPAASRRHPPRSAADAKVVGSRSGSARAGVSNGDPAAPLPIGDRLSPDQEVEGLAVQGNPCRGPDTAAGDRQCHRRAGIDHHHQLQFGSGRP